MQRYPADDDFGCQWCPYPAWCEKNDRCARFEYLPGLRDRRQLALEIDRAFLIMTLEALSALEDEQLEAALADLFVANARAFLSA